MIVGEAMVWSVEPRVAAGEYFRGVADDIALRLDRATAEDLYVTLYEVGEHIAAGARITPPTAGEVERLGGLLRYLGHALGRTCSPYCDHLG